TVADANRDLVERVEDVEQHDGEDVGPVDAIRVGRRDAVETTASPRTAGDGPVFAAALAEDFAEPVGAVVELGRHRTATDAARVRLEDAGDHVDAARRHPEARA